MTKYYKNISKLANLSQEHESSIKIVGSYNSLKDYLNGKFKPLSIRHANEQTESIVKQIKNNPELQNAIDSHCKHSGGTKSIHSLIYFLRNLLDKDVSFTDDELIEYLKDRKNHFSDGTTQESNFSDVGRVGTDANEEFDDEIADFMKYDGTRQ